MRRSQPCPQCSKTQQCEIVDRYEKDCADGSRAEFVTYECVKGHTWDKYHKGIKGKPLGGKHGR